MNFDRRYCQNRVQKKKKKLKSLSPEVKVTSAEEERQFKLSRFVQDVNKFMEEQENILNQESVHKEMSGLQKKPFKKLKSSNALPRRGLFQNGIQTKVYSRGAYGKEMTARLDEDLRQIISLANKGSNNSSHHYRHDVDKPKIAETSLPIVCTSPRLLEPRSPKHPTPPSARSAGLEYDNTFPENDTLLLRKLDNQLYPEFTRIVTLSCVESKSIQFKDKSYVTALKRKLLDIYRHRKKENENSEELSCPSDFQKSSVAASPLRSPSPLSEPQPGCSNADPQHSSVIENGFTNITFVREPLKSSLQFLEETIGPGSSCKSVKASPEPQGYCEHDISFTSWQHIDTLHQDRAEFREPIPRVTSDHPPHNVMMPFDGGGSRPVTNVCNWFLPSCEEDSPEFQYFPRRMF